MIDLHCHLLPGIDDGPKSMDESVGMARFAVDQGIRRCVVTPHIQPGCYDNDAENISRVYIAFRERLEAEGIPLEVGMAAEVRVCGELPQLIMQQKIPFLGQWEGKRVILLEFPHDHIPVGAEKLVEWLLARDILPLIAHPERNQAILRQPAKIMTFVSMGCLLQVTASSVSGLFGESSRQCALDLIMDDLVAVIATDAHNLHKRQPTMVPALEVLRPLIGEARMAKLVSDNPARIAHSQLWERCPVAARA
ncbi:MAG: tyrosine-protein phosphatase [Gammaproteobacteria bacterium]